MYTSVSADRLHEFALKSCSESFGCFSKSVASKGREVAVFQLDTHRLDVTSIRWYNFPKPRRVERTSAPGQKRMRGGGGINTDGEGVRILQSKNHESFNLFSICYARGLGGSLETF